MEHLLHHLLDPSHLHPAIVHFPIALLSVGVFFDLLSLLLKRDDFRKTGFHLLSLGVLSAVAAIGAGLMASQTADAPADILKIHSRLAVATTVLFIILWAWRAKMHNAVSPRLFPLYLFAAVIGAGMIMTVGFWGGHMVYEDAAGVERSLLHRNHQGAASMGEMLPEPSLSHQGPAGSPLGHDHEHEEDHMHHHEH